MNFAELPLCQRILDAIAREGYVQPSPIQRQTIPPAVAGRDILGCAQTGTGKTAAFALPILERLSASAPAPTPRGHERRSHAPVRPVRALVLTPTRELSIQIYESFRAYGRFLRLRFGNIYGGVSQHHQVEALRAGVDILVATPGRLLDLAGQGLLDLSGIEIFVLDEADRMLDMGFIHDVRRVIELIPVRRQTLFFTATMPSEVQALTRTLLTDPVSVAVDPVSSTVDSTAQTVYLTDKAAKVDLLVWLLRERTDLDSVLVFTRTKYGADKLCRKLCQAGIESMAIHGDKSQGARQNALGSFRAGTIRVLVATDIAARGIDIEELACVVNFELPNVPEDYVHRIGRTGRAGRSGTAISLCDFDERAYLANIERLTRRKVDIADPNPFPMTVFTPAPVVPKQPRPSRRAQTLNKNSAK